MRVLDHLIKSIRNAGVFNPEIQTAPACILWPDRDRQWEAVIPALQSALPELMVLGDYAPNKRMGPAIWLRCAISGHLEDISLTSQQVPIFYLPGVSRLELRATQNCPDHVKPLAELQYRGVLWSQINSKDWTLLAYLKSDQGGLGLDVAQDNSAKHAMLLSLYRLLDEDIDLLRGKRLDTDYFNTLLTGGDPTRDLLQWLDQGDVFRASRSESEWQAFVAVCDSQLAFNPQDAGVLAGCANIANQKGPWRAVWERYCEAPGRYPNISVQIRKCSPPNTTLMWHMNNGDFGGWPQWNDEQEKRLHQDLVGLANVPSHQARTKILELEKQHGHRRSSVWAELDDAPLARAMEHLSVVAEKTQSSLAAGTVEDLASGYQNYGWRVDDAVIKALAHVKDSADFEAVKTAIQAVYLPWIEASARHLQKQIDKMPYPGGTCLTPQLAKYSPGDCVLFVDGLRFDMGKRLAASLVGCGVEILEEILWSALPSVTATGKPAVTPVRDKIRGVENTPDFEPSVAETGQPLKGGYHLKKLLQDAGWILLDRSTDGDGQGVAWCEFGDIDHEGHDRGWKLAKHIDTLIQEIRERITGLLRAGWKRILVVTDHGWLLVPGGLPKIELPSALTDNKWGRCASIKPGVSTEESLYPWFWNANVFFALADGVSCFKKGEEYAHGGLSLQECLTIQLTITPSASAMDAEPIRFTDVVWKGLRCTVAVENDFSQLFLDIRSQAGNPDSSVVLSTKLFKENGTASVVVEDEGLSGREATVVLIDSNSNLVAQVVTRIGGGEV